MKGSQALSSAVDAGLQYSPTFQDYAMFINIGAKAYITVRELSRRQAPISH